MSKYISLDETLKKQKAAKNNTLWLNLVAIVGLLLYLFILYLVIGVEGFEFCPYSWY